TARERTTRMASRRASRSPRLPSVIMRSASRRTSLALASVVSICSCSSSEVTMLRSMARRWDVVRPSLRPPQRCLISGLARLADLRESLAGREVLERHAQREAHGGQHLLDLVERLAPEVLGLEHLGLGLLHQLADVLDVGVLEAVRRAHRQLELVHR